MDRRRFMKIAGGLVAGVALPHIAQSGISPTGIIPPTYTALQAFRDLPDSPEMVWLPKGEFLMGSTQEDGWDFEHPQHRVHIDYELAVGKYPVTFEEWDRYAAEAGHRKLDDRGWGRGRRPAIGVSWEDAQDYMKWLSEKTSQHYRLLSEAEWEYAARAGTTSRYWWGDDGGNTFDADAIRDRGPCGDGKTEEVGEGKRRNPWGLHDMLGNVWEWVEDRWHGDYMGAPVDGSVWQGGGESIGHVVRGGSWCIQPWDVRSAYREVWGSPADQFNCVGFRLARTLTAMVGGRA